MKKLFLAIAFALAFFAPFSFAECGNSACESGENSCTCPGDCGSCSGKVDGRLCAIYYCTAESICSIDVAPNCCGNDLCEESGTYLENYGSCARDCEPKILNITILSPVDGYKARYGEELHYKVVLDADGRNVAGSDVSVRGPFNEFVLFNDGLHDDNLFNDGVHAAWASVPKGTPEGFWDVNFFASFRGIDGNASIKIAVYPYVDSEIIVPSVHEIGSNLDVNGMLSINERPVQMPFRVLVETESGKVIASKEVSSSGSDGRFSFSYRSSFTDQQGLWLLSLLGEDDSGNDLNRFFEVMAFEPGAVPKRDLELAKPLLDSYLPGGSLELAVKLTQDLKALDANRVEASIMGKKTALLRIGEGIYAGSAAIPSGASGETLVEVSGFDARGALVAFGSFNISVLPPRLEVKILSPETGLYRVGETIDFTVAVTGNGSGLTENPEVFALFNGKRLPLEMVQDRLFSAQYKIGEDDMGSLEISILAKTDSGSSGESKSDIFVAAATVEQGFGELAVPALALIGIVLAILVVASPFIKSEMLKKSKASKLAELDSLEKRAQEMYFREKSISKQDYAKFMDDYGQRRRELGG